MEREFVDDDDHGVPECAEISIDRHFISSRGFEVMENQLTNMGLSLTSRLDRVEYLLEGVQNVCPNPNSIPLQIVNKSIEETSVSAERKDDKVSKSRDPVELHHRKMKNPRKVLIVGDAQCRGAAELLNDYNKVNFRIETLLKPNAVLEAVVGGLAQLTRDFCKDDFMVVFAGTHDVLRGNDLDVGLIRDLKTSLDHTNVCVVTVPKLNIKPTYNMYVDKFNSKLREVISTINSVDFFLFDISK